MVAVDTFCAPQSSPRLDQSWRQSGCLASFARKRSTSGAIGDRRSKRPSLASLRIDAPVTTLVTEPQT